MQTSKSERTFKTQNTVVILNWKKERKKGGGRSKEKRKKKKENLKYVATTKTTVLKTRHRRKNPFAIECSLKLISQSGQSFRSNSSFFWYLLTPSTKFFRGEGWLRGEEKCFCVALLHPNSRFRTSFFCVFCWAEGGWRVFSYYKVLGHLFVFARILGR